MPHVGQTGTDVNFPQRSPEHIQESRSVNALAQRLPADWIVRHTTERDYGVDCLIEIPIGSDVAGHIFGAQIKSTETLKWQSDGTATLSRIRCSSAHYWLGLPFPVFLFLFVEAENRIYFANIRQQGRARYSELLSQETTHLRMLRFLCLDDEDGLHLLVAPLCQ
jgi:hypothetical protein